MLDFLGLRRRRPSDREVLDVHMGRTLDHYRRALPLVLQNGLIQAGPAKRQRLFDEYWAFDFTRRQLDNNAFGSRINPALQGASRTARRGQFPFDLLDELSDHRADMLPPFHPGP